MFHTSDLQAVVLLCKVFQNASYVEDECAGCEVLVWKLYEV